MKKFASIALLLLSFISVYAGENCVLGIRSFVSPDYPDLARLAQISGEVHLLAKVGEDGRVQGADVCRARPP